MPRRSPPGSGQSRLLRAALPIVCLLLGAAARPDTGTIRYVTDGDTFRLESGERIRIAGIDAPETHADQAKCDAELALGAAASARARALLDHRTVTFVRVGKSYNRTVARVTLDGRDLAAELVEMGVARWWPRYAPKPDWCRGRGRAPGRPRRS